MYKMIEEQFLATPNRLPLYRHVKPLNLTS